ncbi:MAG: TIGR03545 family protein [Planctomycetaceae bacterium]|nr:TIGR03545 family protein [Planctomycetaceae bacterium]
MIRWRFVLTRLFVIAVVLMLLRWGLGPVASYMTTRSLEAMTGAKVEVAEATVGLFPPRVHYTDVRIADPRDGKHLRDAFRAESVDFVIDGDALLHRRWVAREGRISGIQIGSARETSGHKESAETVESSEGPSFLATLVGQATSKLSEQAEQAIGDLETVQRSKQIRSKWETRYAELAQQANDLEKQIRSIRDGIRGIKNPLRDGPELNRMVGQANQVRQELASVRAAIDALPESLQSDLASLQQAKQMDLAKVDAYVPGDLSSSENFGVDLIAEAVRQQVARVKEYLESGRTLADYTVVAPSSDRNRGVSIQLNPQPEPAVMIRLCEVGGVLRADGKQFMMTGILENLTPTPEQLREPTRARLRLEGPETVRVDYVRDRRQAADIDLLTLHWPEMKAKPIRLGKPSDAQLSIAGGQRELWVQIRTQGDEIAGRLVSKQTGATIALAVDPEYADTVAVVAFQESMAAVDRIEIDADFGGTWNDIDLDLNCNLNTILRRASQQALTSQLEDAKTRLAAKIEKTHYDEALSLQRWLGTQQRQARSLLADADQSIQEMNQKVLDEVGNADAYLGKLRGAIRGLR